MLQDREDSLFFSNDMMSEAQDIVITNRIAEDFLRNQNLKKNLNIKSIWILGCGTVMAGPIVGWNWGLGETGPLGMLLVLLILSFFYWILFLITAKLSVLYPYIGGAYGYVRQGLGSFWAYWAGVLTCFQFVGCTAAVLAAFRDYLVFMQVEYAAGIFLGIVFLLIVNMLLFNTKIMTFVHYCLTCCALGILVIFILGTSESVQKINLLSTGPSLGWLGISKALPFVALFFLGLENMTMLAEEVRVPERSMPKGLYLGFGTAVVIAFSIWYFAVGSVNWRLLGTGEFPLLFTLLQVQSQDKVLLNIFTVMSSVGFIAALQGFINGYSRQVYALSRGGYFPAFLSKLHPSRKTYCFAIFVPGVISLGLSYLVTSKQLIIGAFYASVVVHLLVFIAFIKIRNSEPEFFNKRINDSLLLYPAIILLTGILLGFIYNYLFLNFKVIVLSLILTYFYYCKWGSKSIRQEAPEESAATLKMRRDLIRFLKEE